MSTTETTYEHIVLDEHGVPIIEGTTISNEGKAMELTITVPEETKGALEQRARERGYSDVSKYIERLIATDLLASASFDQILAPIRKTFQESGLSDAEVEELFEEAREEVYQERKAQAQ